MSLSKTSGGDLTPGTVYLQDYQSDQPSNLYTLDLVTGNTQLIGAIATSVTDIAFVDSQLYGLDQTDDGQTTLFLNINPTTGEATVIGDIGFAVAGLAYHHQRQTLYATSAKQLIAINPATGKGTPVVTIKDQERNCGEVAFATDGIAYITLIGYDRQKLLATCDLDTGAVNLIGNIGFPDLGSMDFIGDVLYGVTGNFFNLGKDGQLIRIDPQTGTGTLVTMTEPRGRWAGLTVYLPVTQSTPQPTTPIKTIIQEESMTLLTIDTQDHCYVIDQGAMEHLQSNVANSIHLDQGTYTLKIASGRYSYAEDKGQGEPFVLLWIYGIDGSTFVNKNTGFETGATWTTLNGYDDPLGLEVKGQAVVCALFFDINNTDNSGSVTLSITDNKSTTTPQTLTVDSTTNCHLLNPDNLRSLQQWQTNYIDLEPGTYKVTIREGNAQYWSGEQKFKLEPWAILWVKGGKFITKLTGIEVEQSWLSLNGYEDFIPLEVKEKTTVCGLFFDTYKDDNQGQVVLAIEPVSVTHLIEEKEKVKKKVMSDSDLSPETPSDKSGKKVEAEVDYSYRSKRPSSVSVGNLATLSFDSFGRDPARDIVCVTPVRTVVRRQEEITIIRKVRKVEEVDASPACPVNTTQVSRETVGE
ncbi:hypothetical protein [Coleofasciculus sp. E1-EBD-02]|uniref:hypothetical protein n=1 Tax=Coleofasciculus sp. E1-EBD-02 TaxID=3068481 RepID=UPI0032FF0932